MNIAHRSATYNAEAGMAVARGPEVSFDYLNAALERCGPHRPADRQFLAMRQAFQSSGGLARGDDLARLLEHQGHGDSASLAQLIVSRQVFGIAWQGDFWVPMCQFDLRDLSLKDWPRQLLAETAEACDDGSLAAWLVLPNTWLGDLCPVELLDVDLPAVLASARADLHRLAG
jgi:hypothetical protein